MNKRIPILYEHDHSSPPIGYLDAGGAIVLRQDAGITVEQLANLGIGYIPKKIVDGVVVEAELVELSLIVKMEATK